VAMDLIAGAAAPEMVGAGPGPGGPGLGPGGPPPDLAALLGGATPGVDSQEGGSELDALEQISIAVDAYMQIPTVEESERLIAERIKTMVQQLKANNEKMSDQMSGGSPALRKALGP
jgi:hypothetical protein